MSFNILSHHSSMLGCFVNYSSKNLLNNSSFYKREVVSRIQFLTCGMFCSLADTFFHCSSAAIKAPIAISQPLVGWIPLKKNQEGKRQYLWHTYPKNVTLSHEAAHLRKTVLFAFGILFTPILGIFSPSLCARVFKFWNVGSPKQNLSATTASNKSDKKIPAEALSPAVNSPAVKKKNKRVQKNRASENKQTIASRSFKGVSFGSAAFSQRQPSIAVMGVSGTSKSSLPASTPQTPIVTIEPRHAPAAIENNKKNSSPPPPPPPAQQETSQDNSMHTKPAAINKNDIAELAHKIKQGTKAAHQKNVPAFPLNNPPDLQTMAHQAAAIANKMATERILRGNNANALSTKNYKIQPKPPVVLSIPEQVAAIAKEKSEKNKKLEEDKKNQDAKVVSHTAIVPEKKEVLKAVLPQSDKPLEEPSLKMPPQPPASPFLHKKELPAENKKRSSAAVPVNSGASTGFFDFNRIKKYSKEETDTTAASNDKENEEYDPEWDEPVWSDKPQVTTTTPVKEISVPILEKTTSIDSSANAEQEKEHRQDLNNILANGLLQRRHMMRQDDGNDDDE